LRVCAAQPSLLFNFCTDQTCATCWIPPLDAWCVNVCVLLINEGHTAAYVPRCTLFRASCGHWQARRLLRWRARVPQLVAASGTRVTCSIKRRALRSGSPLPGAARAPHCSSACDQSRLCARLERNRTPIILTARRAPSRHNLSWQRGHCPAASAHAAHRGVRVRVRRPPSQAR
jgi:hypothetical protein